MKIRILFIIFTLSVFLLGWKTNELVTDIGEINFENPWDQGFFKAPERPSPHDHIRKEQIKVYSDRVVLEIPNAMWAEFADTRSMEPIIDAGSNSIEIRPQSIADLHVGDIISYKPTNFDGLIVHRIVETGFDNEGWYAITKGDNLSRRDPYKVRFNQIHGVLVAIIY